MSDAPDADVQEQHQEVAGTGGDAPAGGATPADAPDADVQEQRQEVATRERHGSPRTSPEVPEADAAEQAIEVEQDEDR